jgi:methionine synthase II (cobalamin-independent)
VGDRRPNPTFATLLGGLPRPLLGPDAPAAALVDAALHAQESAGLEPVTDGGFGAADDPLVAWQATVRRTQQSVKQALVGPYTAGRDGAARPAERRGRTLDLAASLNRVVRALADAGCPLIEIHEPAAVAIGADPAERALFREAHDRLLGGTDGVHVSLAVVGGSADTAGIETLLAAPYASLAVDLIAGPDNWRLVVATPGERGIVCGALSPAAGSYDGPEPLLWAAGYAASGKGRGPSRVGLATAGSLAALPWAVAVAKIDRLGEAARLASAPIDERLGAMDPRAVSSRAAALGQGGVGPWPPAEPGDDPT